MKFLKGPSSIKDVWLFLVLLIAGSLWIWVSRREYQADADIALIGPLVALALYALLLLKTRFFELREDRAGDNLYFLGFLYTLTSLGVALFGYESGTGSDGVDEIIQDLGVALVTTIAGLALRIAFLQLRVDPEEVSEDARLQLTDALARFHIDVANMAEISRRAHTMFGQMTEEAKEKLHGAMQGIASSAKGLDGSVLRLQARLDSVHVPEDLYTAPFDKAADALARSVQEKTKQIDDFNFNWQPTADQIRSSLTTLQADIRNLAEASKLVADMPSRLDAVSRGLESLAIIYKEGKGTVEDRVRNVVDEFERAETHTTQMGKNIHNLSGEFSQAKDHIHGLSDEFSQARKRIHDLSRQFEQTIEHLLTVANNQSPKRKAWRFLRRKPS